MLTYGDGVSDVDLDKLLAFHKAKGKLATITAVQPGGRFGTLEIKGDSTVNRFAEKHKEDGGWINGGFMVLEPKVINYIEGDSTTFECEPLEEISKESQLCAYQHYGFWQCMDTIRDKQQLEALLQSGKAPWKLWK
jgi:glucose-1-phosphate cytidylyltransferase